MRLATTLATLLCMSAFGQGALAQSPGEAATTIEKAVKLLWSDPAAARKLIAPLAAANDPEALNILAALIDSGGPDWPADAEEAARIRDRAIAAGSKAAAFNLATQALLDPNGDHARAVQLLKQAETDDALAAFTHYPWGRAYLFGWGVERDMAEGIRHLEASLKGPDAGSEVRRDAEFLLGRAYQSGWNVEIDAPRAFRHMSAAADLGDPRAQWSVGMMLLQGEGVQADEQAAYRFVSQSAENGHVDGMISRAVMLAVGQGVDEDDAAARVWYLEAAGLGSAHGLRGLGFMLVSGEGGPGNPALGVALLELAAEAGEQNAPILLRSIPAEQMPTKDDVAQAKALWLADMLPPGPVR